MTSYRVTSSLSLSDAAYEQQQRAIQHPPTPSTPNAYAQAGYETPQDHDTSEQPYSYYAEGEGEPGGEQAAPPAEQQYTEQDLNYDPYTDPYGYWASDGQYYDYDPGQDTRGYWGDDQQYHYLETEQGDAEGYYDENGNYQYYSAEHQQQDYANQGYDQQDYNSAYDQQNYDPNGYNDPYAGYDQQAAEPEIPKRKRKIESVRDHYAEILGEGQVSATDAEDSPHQHVPRPSQQNAQYLDPNQLPQGSAQPHMAVQSPLVQMLGPAYDIFIKLKSKWAFINEKIAQYTDMIIDLQDSVQKEMKEAAGQAFKGLMSQLKQRSPLAVPYQATQPGMPGPDGQMPPGGDPNQAYPQAAPAPRYDPVSFVDLKELNVEFTDNYDQPLFDFSKYANSQYQVSKMIVDPTAMETALWAIRECAARAGAIPPAQEGPYANLPLNEVMDNITEEDLLAFLNYVKAFPGNYVSRNLKISETFATWVVYGAPTP